MRPGRHRPRLRGSALRCPWGRPAGRAALRQGRCRAQGSRRRCIAASALSTWRRSPRRASRAEEIHGRRMRSSCRHTTSGRDSAIHSSSCGSRLRMLLILKVAIFTLVPKAELAAASYSARKCRRYRMFPSGGERPDASKAKIVIPAKASPEVDVSRNGQAVVHVAIVKVKMGPAFAGTTSIQRQVFPGRHSPASAVVCICRARRGTYSSARDRPVSIERPRSPRFVIPAKAGIHVATVEVKRSPLSRRRRAWTGCPLRGRLEPMPGLSGVFR